VLCSLLCARGSHPALRRSALDGRAMTRTATTRIASRSRDRFVRPHSPDDPGSSTPIPHDPPYGWCHTCRRPVTAGRACQHLSVDEYQEVS
jgi:hypothetical protein